jgi:23S rRNA (guanosine2251-2'-O)-methyltransferase
MVTLIIEHKKTCIQFLKYRFYKRSLRKMNDVKTEVIAGRNSVIEALKSGRAINKILMSKGETQGSAREIAAKAKELGLVVQRVESAKLEQMSGTTKHQGVIALVSPVAYAEFEDILKKAQTSGETPFLLLLENIADPHNVGAILRTADAAGVHGVLIPKRRSCPLTQTVAKTSAGAVEHVSVARIGNVAAAIKQLKKEGFWIIGSDAAANSRNVYWQADFKRPLVVVIGSEGEGLSRLTKENCDFLVGIPMRGEINSLNASVACSLILYEVLRQRGGV